ncbi:MAG: molybdate ABC transporter substrate-binding protein [Anaerolineales bacterium]|jgi:molybdate transport system substrate-binding protein|nr:molybdate ABC transporter substrate-binding protein [Anaerolineales bacterium]
MKTQRLIVPLLALALLLAACGAPAPAATAAVAQPTAEVLSTSEVPAVTTELVVMAASSLTDAFNEIADVFEAAHPGVEVLPNYASSSSLATQLVEGAPADVFASANNTQMGVVAEAQRLQGEATTFLTNRLTIIVPADNPAGIESYADLAKAGLALILAAPDVPVREYSNQAIALMGDAAWQAAVFANLVSEEPNVRQVATKISLGEGDAGIVYTSDVTPDIAGSVLQIAIPDEMNVIASYPIAVVEGAPAGDIAQAFVDFVLGAEGQATLAKWGFGPRP